MTRGFRHPHPGGHRGRTRPAGAAGTPAADPPAAAAPPAPAPAASPAHQEASAERPAELAQVPPFAVFGAGVLVGGVSVALARMRRRQRQARRFGRRIPLPVSAPVIAAEQRLRAAEQAYAAGPGSAAAVCRGGTGAAVRAGRAGCCTRARTRCSTRTTGWIPGACCMTPRGPEPGTAPHPGTARRPGPLPQPPTALRAALSGLGAGLVAAGQPIPDITGVWMYRSGLELLLASPSGEPPPAPFGVPGGRQGMAWRLELPRHVPSAPYGPAQAGDLLPGLLTAGVAADGGYVLIDLEHLRVTTVDGPADLADLVLSTAAAELTTSQLAGWYDLILAGFPELAAVDGRATSCASLAEALDLLASKAVAHAAPAG